MLVCVGEGGGQELAEFGIFSILAQWPTVVLYTRNKISPATFNHVYHKRKVE